MLNYSIGVVCGIAAVGCMLAVTNPAAGATFQYQLVTSAGAHGPGPTGTITFTGNVGDPIPNLNAAGITFSFNWVSPGLPVTSFPDQAWTDANSIFNTLSDFNAGTQLGDATLVPDGGSFSNHNWAVDNPSPTRILFRFDDWGVADLTQGTFIDQGSTVYFELVPEPASVMLLGLGGAVMLRRR